MALTPSSKIEVRIPSQVGYEQVAADASAAVARIMGFAPERIEDLKTALREACRNAMEHAHHMDSGIPVGITFTVELSALRIEVEDQGDRAPLLELGKGAEVFGAQPSAQEPHADDEPDVAGQTKISRRPGRAREFAAAFRPEPDGEHK